MGVEAVRSRILEFKSDQEIELSLLISEIETFAPEILWMQGYEIYDWISEVKRAWWIREKVGIPLHLAESVLEHSMNVKNAADSVILWTPEIVIVPANFPIMWKVHDMPEWHRILPDITPHCPYNSAQKAVLEKYAVLYIEVVLKKAWELETKLLREYIEQKTPDSKIMHIIDKIDAWIKALDYEKIWFKKQVADFHPYTKEKIAHNPYFSRIYEIMLEREFKTIPSHLQYFMLLEMAWNYDKWRKRMTEVEKQNQ